MIGLAEVLVTRPGHLDMGALAVRFSENYDPRRGYGANAHRILADPEYRTDRRRVVDQYRLPGGSFANGAAMRVAPVALAFLGSREILSWIAEDQTKTTGHNHPLGHFRARLQALAIHRALEYASKGAVFRVQVFLNGLLSAAPGDFRQALRWITQHLTARAIIQAINLGGDTDTIGAMTGAIAGAYHGANALPDRWVQHLEQDDVDYVLELADRIHAQISTQGLGFHTSPGGAPHR